MHCGIALCLAQGRKDAAGSCFNSLLVGRMHGVQS
jgi:hypothetical protein